MEVAPVRHVWGDIDDDGLNDLFILYSEGNLLFLNSGDGGFEDVTALAFPDGAGEGGMAFWGDYNADKRIDLFLFQEKEFKLYRNDGKLHFQDVTESLGFQPGMEILGAQLEDYDGDGFKDLLVETTGGDQIYRNRKGTEFGAVSILNSSRRNAGSRNNRGAYSTGISAGGSVTPGGTPETLSDFSDTYVNDNSPGSVGIGIPEVEGGDDDETLNDIKDGTVTGKDLKVPCNLGGTTSKWIFKAVNTDGSDGICVYAHDDSDIGDNYAVYAISDSSDGTGVFGWTTSDSGVTHGIHGRSDSPDGRGVVGLSTDQTGENYGVYGRSNSEKGVGVYGVASSSNAGGVHPTGVYGASESPTGYGVHGESTAASGKSVGVYGTTNSPDGYGVYGMSSSPDGTGIYGQATADSGETNAILGQCASPEGKGVMGLASSETGINYGVYGKSSSDEGRGVYGWAAHDESGTTYGVFGKCDSWDGYGVFGAARATFGTTWGVKGINYSTFGGGVLGIADQSWEYSNAVGVFGQTNSIGSYGVFSSGDYGGTGAKYFVQPHPTDPSKEIRFVCLEGNESGTYFRGSSMIQGGKAVVEVPEAFRYVTDSSGLTVQVTPMGPARIWVAEKSLEQIVIRGDTDVEFDYFVNGVRRGFSSLEPIRENNAYVPQYRGKPYGTQYPAALRRILVENGILNPDFTPNEDTARRLGWTLKESEVESAR